MQTPIQTPKPWVIRLTSHHKTHIFGHYTSRAHAETDLSRLRRIIPHCTLEVCWNG